LGLKRRWKSKLIRIEKEGKKDLKAQMDYIWAGRDIVNK
jgi:hypothetical protein